MELNRKGFFFTSIAILILSILMIGLRPLPSDVLIDQIPVIEERVLSVNDYVKELDYDYINKALLVSSRSAFISYSKHIIQNGSFENENDMQKNIFSLMVYGNLTNGVIKNNYSLVNLLNNITTMINDSMRVETTINYGDFSEFAIYQDNSTGPWHIGLNFSLNFSVESDLAIWNISQKNYNILVHVDNLPDAYLSINSNENVNIRNITPSPFTDWNYTSFKAHFKNETYSWSNISPNFLSRLINRTSPDNQTGIHTIIGTQSGDLGGPLVGEFYNKSFIDFCYFSDKCDEKLYNVTAITNATYPFRIDEHHLRHYALRLNSTEIGP